MVQKASLEKASKQWLKYKESADKAISEGNYELSESVLFAALTEAQDFFNETDYQFVYTLEKLVQSLWFLGRYTEAIEHCQKLVDIHAKNAGKLEPVNRLTYTINLAMLLHASKSYDQADNCYQIATEQAKSVFSSDHVIVTKVRGLHADLLEKAGYQDKLNVLGVEPKAITASDWLPSEVLKMIKDSLNSRSSYKAPQAISPPPHPSTTQGSPQAEPTSRNQKGSSLQLPPPASGQVGLSMVMPPPPPDRSKMSTPPPIEARASDSDSKEDSPSSKDADLPPVSSANVVSPKEGEIAVCFTRAEVEAVYLSNQFTAKANQKSGDIEVAVLLNLINLKLLEQFDVKDEMLTETLETLTLLKQKMGLHKDAAEFAKRCYEHKMQIFGAEHIEVAHSANKLAGIFYSLGYLEEAIDLTEFCIQIYQNKLGESHPSVASSMHNLATLYHVQKQYTKAEENYKNCLELKNKIFGSNHPSTSRLLKSYAELLRETHREAEAEHMSTMAMGMITGSWKAISEEDLAEKETASGAGKGTEEEEACENCKWPLKGEAICQVCGHRTRKRSTTSFSDL